MMKDWYLEEEELINGKKMDREDERERRRVGGGAPAAL
jgi:hypothetical protein